MAGLAPAIHVLLLDNHKYKDVDARHKAGHDAKSKYNRLLAGSR